MACPEPVIRTKDALEDIDEGILDVWLNSYSSIQNVKRFATKEGLYHTEKKVGKTTIISIVKGYECGLPEPEEKEERSFWALIAGAVVTAILASTCCIAPLMFLLFGISASSLSFLKPLAPYHWLFVALAVAILSYLWYHYFTVIRKRIVCEGWICKYYLTYLSIGTIFIALLLSYQYWIVYFLGD